MKLKASVIIPAFNEQEGIKLVLDQLTNLKLQKKYEILIVDDGSTDGTDKIVEKYPVKLIKHMTNKGYGAAIKTGIRLAKCEKVIILDGDGQHSPVYINKIVGLLNSYYMVIGIRDEKSQKMLNRKIGKRLIRIVAEYLADQKLPDFNSGFRGFRKKTIIGLLHLMPNGFSFSTTSTLAFIKHGYEIYTFPINVRPRLGRPSSVKLFTDGFGTVLLVIRIIMLFNPLRIFLPASIITGFVAIAWTLFGIIAGPRIPNSAVLIGIFSMLLFFIGLLADQISVLNLHEKQ